MVLSSRAPTVTTFNASFPNLPGWVWYADLCFRYAWLTDSNDLYWCSVGGPCILWTFHLVTLSCSHFHNGIHRLSSFLVSNCYSSLYCSPEKSCYGFLQILPHLLSSGTTKYCAIDPWKISRIQSNPLIWCRWGRDRRTWIPQCSQLLKLLLLTGSNLLMTSIYGGILVAVDSFPMTTSSNVAEIFAELTFS